MKEEQKQQIFTFLQDQIANAEFRVKAYVFDENGRRRLGRNAFVRLIMHLQNFLIGKSTVRWLVMCGLRGAGKTTLLAQMYEQTNVEGKRKLFLSVDQVIGVFGVSLRDVLTVYEDILGSSFEQLQEPVFLFLDEVQYDPQWGLLLKTIYDRSNKVFIVATGSSALSLQASPDVARRCVFEKLYPMSFTEFIKIKKQKTESKGLARELRETIFNSRNAQEVFDRLKNLEARTRRWWVDIDRRDIDRYMHYGTLPYMVALNNEALIYDQIKKTLERVVSVDIPHISQFSSDTIAKIPMVLYALAESEQVVLHTLAQRMEISRPVLAEILETLERTETIWRIYPHGSHAAQTRQSSKYLFTSPAFRAMYFNFIGNTRTADNYKGKIFEDTIGLYINRIFSGRPNVSVTYDSAAGGADFIIRDGKESVVLEVGSGRKTFDQLERTMDKIGLTSKYGILVSQSPLAVDPQKNTVSIPFSYFLLM